MLSEYWIISAPGDKTCQQTFDTMNNLTSKQHNLCNNYKFHIPDLKVGTLDQLVGLSDDLGKLDTYVEQITRKVANYLNEVLEDQRDKLHENLQANNSPGPPDDSMPCRHHQRLKHLSLRHQRKHQHTHHQNNPIHYPSQHHIHRQLPADIKANLPQYLTRFQWDMAKYPIKQSLRNIADIISKQIGQIDGDLKTKSQAYNNLKGNLQNLEKKKSGSLLTRNLADLVKKEHFILDSEYLTTLLVIVPKAMANDWLANYEKITDMIVPRSSQLIKEDPDYCLFNVTLFKKVAEEFKLHARERKFIVRDFVYNEEELAAGKNEITKLMTDKKKQFGPLVRWLKVNFSEAFCALIHVKALRVFVESVLRYGLPVNFQAILIEPNKKSVKRLRDVLNQLYGHLDGAAAGGHVSSADNVDIPGLGFGQSEYFPYVFYKVNIEMVEQPKV
ncbi:V-type proton ATPase subunit C isoform X5 [Drosophila tropicalis]|uniref:V-type proton ATPase subunit C isoform X5 n=1 Tax=Drosophila tropicalis TaxID=46794 RepID=UPI000732980A|nr:uncharacterized protein Dwil_GK21692, isoform C [Drosophila willistoni]